LEPVSQQTISGFGHKDALLVHATVARSWPSAFQVPADEFTCYSQSVLHTWTFSPAQIRRWFYYCDDVYRCLDEMRGEIERRVGALVNRGGARVAYSLTI